MEEDPGMWLEVRLTGRESSQGTPEALFPFEGDALFVHLEDRAIVWCRSPEDAKAALKNSSVRELTSQEAASAREEFPFPLPEFGDGAPHSRRVGLGDLVAVVTSLLGFRECEGCGQRRRVLNRVKLWMSREG